MMKRLPPSLFVIAAWEAAARIGIVNPVLLPPPSQVGLALAEWASQSLVFDVTASVLRVLAGFTLASLGGIGAGLALGSFGPIRRGLTPILEVLRPIPPIAWIPLAVLWFGVGSASAVFIVAIGGFFPVMTATYVGVTSVSVTAINTAKCLGATRWLLITDILLPASLPAILGGLRTGLGVAWMSLIAAELVGAQSGLGYMIQLNRLLLKTEHVLAGMLVVGVIGLLTAKAMTAAEQRLMPWRRGPSPATQYHELDDPNAGAFARATQ